MMIDRMSLTVQVRPEDLDVLALAAFATGNDDIPSISLSQFITELIELAAAKYRHDHTKCHCQGPEPCEVPADEEDE